MKPQSVERINQWIKDNKLFPKYELISRLGKKGGHFKCKKHDNEYDQLIDVFKNGSLGCKKCEHENKIKYKRTTKEDYLIRLDNYLESIGLEKGRYTIRDNQSDRLIVQCNRHNPNLSLEWRKNDRFPKHFPCKICQSEKISNGKSLKKDDIQPILNNKFKKLPNGVPCLEYLDKYSKENKTPSFRWFRCNKPNHGGHVFEQRITYALRGHVATNGCPICYYEKRNGSVTNKHSYAELKLIVNEIYDNQFVMPKTETVDYKNVGTIIEDIECKVCHRTFKSSIKRLIYKGSGCGWHDCATKKFSNGEKIVKTILKELKIESIGRFSFENFICDFYLPNFNLIIEYDGRQHFEPVFGDKEFEEGKRRDREKNELAKCKKHNLLRISYENNKTTIGEIVRDVLTRVNSQQALQFFYGDAYLKLM